jgi:hypothetical protein
MSKSDLDQLTHQGQQFYADARQDGATHEQAMKDALHSYGKQRGKRANLRRDPRNVVRRGGWVAPLQGAQFMGLAANVGEGANGEGGDGGGGEGGGGEGGV